MLSIVNSIVLRFSYIYQYILLTVFNLSPSASSITGWKIFGVDILCIHYNYCWQKIITILNTVYIIITVASHGVNVTRTSFAKAFDILRRAKTAWVRTPSGWLLSSMMLLIGTSNCLQPLLPMDLRTRIFSFSVCDSSNRLLSSCYTSVPLSNF